MHQRQPGYQWSASLWYARPPNTPDYRWYEVSYFAFRDEGAAPYSLMRSIKDADLTAAPIMHIYQLALASQGKLGHPRGLPLQPYFWRQAFVA